jgi:hypothetical protein
MNAQRAVTQFVQRCLSPEKARRFTELSATKKGRRKVLASFCHEFEPAVRPDAAALNICSRPQKGRSSIAKPEPATPPDKPTTTAQRHGAQERQSFRAIHATIEPDTRLANPKDVFGSTQPSRTNKRIHAALPRQARRNAPTMRNLLVARNSVKTFTCR